MDIAKSLQVSKTLVSMVLNGRGDEIGISAITQRKVLAKAKELNYKPNQFARALRMGKSNTLGIIVSDVSNSFYAKICRAVEDEANRHGYNLMICSSDEDAAKEETLIQMLKERQVDGLIISTTQSKNDDFIQLKREQYPFVLIDRKLNRMETNYVVVDNVGGAERAVGHLLDLGNKRVGMLAISPSHISSIKERIKGYKNAYKKRGLRVDNRLIREIPFEDLSSNVARELKSLMMAPHNISAVFVANNNLAVECMNCLSELKLRVPQDIAIISFDDIDLFKFCYPPITSISQPVEQIGRESVQLLLETINSENGESKNKHRTLETDLKVRRSCGSFLAAM